MGAIKLKHTSGNGTILNSPAANPSSDITLKLPSTTGSAGQVLSVASANHSSTNAELEFAAAAAGITEADSWRITSNLSSSSGTFSANWERTDTEFNKLGTGLTESSGVFSFPSNGLYLLHFHSTGAGNGDRYMGVILKVSTDNGANYSTRVENYASVYNSGNNTWGNVSIDVLLDVTNYADFKFYFNHSSSGTITWYGDTNNQWTGLYTLRIGDT